MFQLNEKCIRDILDIMDACGNPYSRPDVYDGLTMPDDGPFRRAVKMYLTAFPDSPARNLMISYVDVDSYQGVYDTLEEMRLA